MRGMVHENKNLEGSTVDPEKPIGNVDRNPFSCTR